MVEYEKTIKNTFLHTFNNCIQQNWADGLRHHMYCSFKRYVILAGISISIRELQAWEMTQVPITWLLDAATFAT